MTYIVSGGALNFTHSSNYLSLFHHFSQYFPSLSFISHLPHRCLPMVRRIRDHS